MTRNLQPSRGGARPGAGRKTRDGVDVRRVTLSLDEATLEVAQRLGGGDVSLGLRELARRSRGLPHQDWTPA